jgi:hypothetical protein
MRPARVATVTQVVLGAVIGDVLFIGGVVQSLLADRGRALL